MENSEASDYSFKLLLYSAKNQSKKKFHAFCDTEINEKIYPSIKYLQFSNDKNLLLCNLQHFFCDNDLKRGDQTIDEMNEIINYFAPYINKKEDRLSKFSYDSDQSKNDCCLAVKKSLDEHDVNDLFYIFSKLEDTIPNLEGKHQCCNISPVFLELISNLSNKFKVFDVREQLNSSHFEIIEQQLSCYRVFNYLEPSYIFKY